MSIPRFASSTHTGPSLFLLVTLSVGGLIHCSSSSPDGSEEVLAAESALGHTTTTYDLWTNVGSMVTPRVNHTGTTLADGRVLIAGGWVSFANLSPTAEIYDPVTKAFSSAGTFPNGRWAHRATLMKDGRAVISGGELPGNVFLTSVVAYDPALNSWTALADMKYARRNHLFVTLSDGKLMACGGAAIGDPLIPSTNGARVCETYDPIANTWTETGKLNQGRQHPEGAALSDGRVLIAGGIDGNLVLDTAEVWDPATGMWTLLASKMSNPRYVFASASLSDGKVLFIGGGINASASPTNQVDVFDPATNMFASTGSMGTARAYHVAAPIPGGRVLVAGGNGLASADVYNPATGQWSPAPTMSQQRAYASANSLPSGGVLVVGGGPGPLSPSVTAEVFKLDLAQGASCNLDSECVSGFCVDSVCCDQACSAGACDACSVATGAMQDGTCTMLTGNACDDGDACTQTDTCTAGVCTGANPTTCVAADQCHDPGICDPGTGACSNPAKADGTVCDDGDACTQMDACQAGACVSSGAVECVAQDECHDAGACDPKTGACTSPAKEDGALCTGGACKSGVCVPNDTSSSSSSGGGGSGTGGSGGQGGDGGAGTGGNEPTEQGGCACSLGSRETTGGFWLGISVALLLSRRRRSEQAEVQPD